MTNKLNMSLQKESKRVRMRSRMLNLILLVVIFQLLTLAAVLAFGGEFSSLKGYSYDALAEKSESSSAYVRNKLLTKPAIVQEYAVKINNAVSEALKERGASVADLRTDEELSRGIIESSAEILSDLLRSASVDDVYLILETGGLFADEDGNTAKAALYLQNEDGDMLTVIGFDSVSEALGLTPSPERTEYFTIDNTDTFDFYNRTIQTVSENRSLSQNALGYWSGSSGASSSLAPSMKYSLPLISDDHTVYGVFGIGMTESSLFSELPKNDHACYVLARSGNGKVFDITAHYGPAYGTLIGSADALYIDGEPKANECIYDFDKVADAELTGGVHFIDMYDSNSPYVNVKWALIYVADRADVLRTVSFLSKMLVVSAVLSIIVALVIAVPGCGIIIKPLTELSKLLRAKRKYNEVVRFQPSNVYEVDDITDAITQMQINIHGFSSQVSKMISIADVGLGTFMYDRTDDSVFVGQSLIEVLKLDLPQGEDIVMSRQDFLNSIKNPEMQNPIGAGLGMHGGDIQGDFSDVYRINQPDGSTLWIRLGYTYSPTTAIGIVQDITEGMIEKNRIEYERDHDSLTGLLNRHAYYRNVEKLFRDRSKLGVTAFIMIDLDNLKYVNDTYGHNYGDDYLKTAAAALKKFQNYGGVVSRLSGDEFSICLHGFTSKEIVREIIAKVRGEFLQSSCLLADGTHFKINGSMGVSWYPDDAESRELLMKYADFAMYTVKHSTKGEIAEFDRNSYSADSVLLTGVEEMNRIIEESAVKYAFQSIVSAKTGEIYGYEALMRVQSQIFQSPLELLRAAKTGAKLYEIERLTMTKSLEDFQSLIDAGVIGKSAHIFVNSIANNRLEQDVEDALQAKYSHLMKQIVIEILESESSDEESTAHKAQLIRNWGGQLALDDFGTGYNSEYALLNLRPNIIKIDRSIISGCDHDAGRRMIIENLVKLAGTKDIRVLAEGVETEEEMKTVISCGVDLLQGYYLAHPVFSPEPLAPEIAGEIRRLADSVGNEKISD